MKSDFSIVLFDNARGRAYIQYLCNNNLFPEEVLLMPSNWTIPSELKISDKIGFDITESVHETIKKHSLKVINLNEADINAPDTIEKIKNCSSKYVIFGGRGGQILKSPVLQAGKPILHIHPGITPFFRGSTTVYYSNLAQGKAGCSAFFFNEKIDEGDIIIQKEYEMIKNVDIDYLFDPEIRAKTLVSAVKKLAEEFKTTPQTKALAYPYFIIHPVLKHLSILKNSI